jgi:DNA-binding SARP family transcriptional activator
MIVYLLNLPEMTFQLIYKRYNKALSLRNRNRNATGHDKIWLIENMADMANLKLFLFGQPRLEYQGEVLDVERRKALALVAYLAIAEQPQSRDLLATLLWPDLDQQHARTAMRSTLPSLTSLIPDGWLDADRMSIALNREALWVDVTAFLSLLAQTRSHEHSPDNLCNVCVDLLKQAVTLYRGDFMTGFTVADSIEYDDWQMFQREWLRREFAGALKRLAHHYTNQGVEQGEGAYDEAIKITQRWLALDPLHEPAQRLLMRLYMANGQRADALRQYQECVRLLDEELATPPEEETVRLYEAIKTNTVIIASQNSGIAETIISVLPPLPPLIIGRENVLAELKQRLGIPDSSQMRPITVIQGWPGVGKSTTIAALAYDPEITSAFPDGVLWASLGEAPSLLASLLIWADALKVAEAGQSRTLKELTAQLTAALRDKRMLLIVDDVWETQHAAPFKLGGQGCALVMTSRLNDVAQTLAPTLRDIYRLPLLSEDTALQLLQALAPQAVAQYPDDSRELVRDLEGLPLAIQVAGRLLESEIRLGWGVGDLLVELRQGAGLLAAEAPGDMGGVGRDTLPTIAALLKRSTDSLDEETRQRFAYLGLFVPKPATFDLQAMSAAWGISDPRPTARILVNRGLLEPVSGGRFQMHALLVLHAHSLLDI